MDNANPLDFRIRSRPERRNCHLWELDNVELEAVFARMYFHRGQTLGTFLDKNRHYYDPLMEKVEELERLGAISVVEPEIILENSLLSPLERLARAAKGKQI